MGELSSSPVVVKDGQVQMDFPNAIRKVVEGEKITKIEWGDSEYYGVISEGFLRLHKPDGKFYDWIISDGDLCGEDWIVAK